MPRYYERGPNGIPAGWTERMRSSIGSTLWRFSTTRMLHEYTEQLYLPAAGVVVTARPDRRAGEPEPAGSGTG